MPMKLSTSASVAKPKLVKVIIIIRTKNKSFNAFDTDLAAHCNGCSRLVENDSQD